MRVFYILLIAMSGGYLTVQLIAWIFYGKRFFPDSGELFTDKADKNLWQTVFPKDMLRLIIVVFSGAAAGLLMDAAGLPGSVSMPLAAFAGVLVNFISNMVFIPIHDKLHKSNEPSDEELEGLSARVIEEIDPENFGVIEVKHGSKNYLMRAVSANGRRLKKSENVIVIYAQDSCCFVESEKHLCDILFEEGEQQ